jgi:uncharacterized protein YfaP (DUF2135 family)
MRIILTLTLLLALGCSKPQVLYDSEVEEREGRVYAKGGDQPFTGIVVEKSSLREVHYRAGRSVRSQPLTASAPASAFSAEFDRRLRREGALTGEIQISLMWDSTDDLDLHCWDPRGEHIFFENKRSRSGGHLDVDMNVDQPFSPEPVENIYWPDDRAPQGRFRVRVHCYTQRSGRAPIKFKVVIKAGTAVKEFTGQVSEDELADVHEFTMD